MKKGFALVLACTLAVSAFATGCGKETVSYDRMGTFDGKKVDYDLVKFMASYEQAKTEKDYRETLGDDMWSVDYEQDGTTLLDDTKNDIIDTLHSMLVMEKYAKDSKIELTEVEKKKITIAAKEFIDNNKKETLEKMAASQSVVERYLQLYTIYYKMYEKIGEGADQNIKAEDINQKTISYVAFSYYTGKTKSDGTKEKLSDKDIALLNTKAKDIREKATKDFDAAMTEAKAEVKKVSYGHSVSDISGLEDVLVRASERLSAEGDVSEVVKGEEAYYIVRLDKLQDDEATAKKKEEVIKERKETAFQTKYEELSAKSEFKVDKKAWATITFEDPLTIED